MTKRFISILLVCLLLAHLAGFYVYFIVRLGDLRMTMRQQLSSLPSGKLDKLTLPIQEFKMSWWEEREMEWEGKMYDIARLEYAGDRVIVYCLHDEAEDNLVAFMTRIVEMSSQDKDPAPTSVIQFFQLKFVITGLALTPCYPPMPITHFSVYCPSLSEVDHLPVTPPPRS